MTPAQYAARVQAWERREERRDYRAALAPWVVANVYRGKRSAYKIEDFMPQKKGTSNHRGPSKAQQLAWAAMLRAMAKENPLIKESKIDGHE